MTPLKSATTIDLCPPQSTPSGRLMLPICLIVSLLLHGALGWALHDAAIGSIDPKLFAGRRPRLRIQRALRDIFLEEGTRTTLEDIQHKLPKPSALSATLLEQPAVVEDQLSAINDPTITPLRHLPELTAASLYNDSTVLTTIDLPSFVHNAVTAVQHESFQFADTARQPNGLALVATGKLNSIQQANAALEQPHRFPSSAGSLSQHGLAIGTTTLPQLLQSERIGIRLPKNQPLEMQTIPINFAALPVDPYKSIALPKHLDEDFNYAVSTFHNTKKKIGYFRVDIQARRSLQKLRTMPKDVVFLIDTSASIPQLWIDQVVRGVGDSLAALNPNDRFNIVLFSEQAVTFHPNGIATADDTQIAAARQFLSNATSYGYTDVNRVVSRLIVRDVEIERVYNLILISDGVPTRGVIDTRQLINLITRDNDLNMSIYCIGVGAKINRELLEYLAYCNKGYCIFTKKHRDVGYAVRDLLGRLRHPIMKEVYLSSAGLDDTEVYPIVLADLCQGQQLSVFGTFKTARSFTMHIAGQSHSSRLDFTFNCNLHEAQPGDKTIAHDWAFWKLHHLYSRSLKGIDSDALRTEIQQLRKQLKLKTLY